jgi:uncharacterized protein
MSELLHQFNNQLYLNLETFRKNGTTVRTPVWFTEENNIFYVRTILSSGKVKRIRNNGNVRIVPCEVDGRILGQWVECHAYLIVDPVEADRIEHAFDAKYGEAKKNIDLQRLAQGLPYATIAITL